MTLDEMERKVFSLIEELNPNNPNLTDDPDLAAKKRYVINQVLFELARIKKIPKYIEFEVSAGDLIDKDRIESESGYEVYQIVKASGIKRDLKAQGTVVKAMESGTLELELYVYPERITEKTSAKAYEFELSDDALEIMPYGVAADLLKSDVSTQYGKIYADRYRDMKEQLDPRYVMGGIYVEGGYDI